MSNNYFIKRNVTDENGLDTQLQKSSQKLPSISLLKFPFILKEDQTAAVNAWINNNHRGTILYSTGTGKTEIAFECAKILATHNLSYDIQLLHTKKSVADIDKIPKDGQKEFEASLDQNNNIVANSNNENVSHSFFNILFLVLVFH
jgi:superfamily II DNA or RNA helicase